MKKFFLFLTIAAGLLAGCQRLDSEFIPATGDSVSFTAQLQDTKTVFGDKEDGLYPVLFTSEDKELVVSLNAGTPVHAAVHPSADGRYAYFQADFPATADECSFAVFSPASALKDFSSETGKATLSLPAEQSPSAGSCDPTAQLLAGFTASVSGLPEKIGITLSHLSSYAKVSFTGVGNLEVTGASITSESFELAGDAEIDLASHGMTVSGGSKTVSVSTSSAQNVWFGLLPCQCAGTAFTFELQTTEGSFRKSVTLPEGRNFASGTVASFTVDMSTAEFEKADPNSISILAVGNSFSVDAMQYLYDILSQMGYKKISLGNLYIGGCSLKQHAEYLVSKKDYEFKTNLNGTWQSVNSSSIDAMKSRRWDYVSVQQASPNSGQADTYEPYLSALVDSIKLNCPTAKIMWHMTWAYAWTYTSTNFGNYGYDQNRMYADIVSAVQSKILPREDISLVIPSGTAIQNLRTSYMADSFNRDGFHLHYGRGRLAAALMWAKSITGRSIDEVSYSPASYPVDAKQLAAIKEAVNAAYEKPFEPTPADAQYTPNADLGAKLSAAGYKLEDYEELPYMATPKAYYNSTSSAALAADFNGSTAANLANFICASHFFSKAELPYGTLLVLKDGWQYRPEGWTSLRSKNAGSARPANVQTPVVEIDASWWGSWNFRAFNISKTTGAALTAEELATPQAYFAIFVPKN